MQQPDPDPFLYPFSFIFDQSRFRSNFYTISNFAKYNRSSAKKIIVIIKKSSLAGLVGLGFSHNAFFSSNAVEKFLKNE